MLESFCVSKQNGLSLIIITFNEGKDLEDCLKSVQGLADEIVLVDSGSTDQTLDIARRYNAKIFEKKWNGYGAQKQYALDHAQGPWVLNLDADERLTPNLKLEISSVLDRNGVNGFEVPYRHFFMKRQLRFGGLQGETHIRLFRKDKAAYGKSPIHEGIEVERPHGELAHPIDHFSYSDVEDYLAKCNWYTTLIAKEKFQKGERFHWWHHLRLPFEFFVRYFIKLGLLDGGAGLTYALLSSYYVWLKYLKLKDLEVSS